MTSPQYRAGADINRSVFVKISADDTVVTAGNAEEAVGIMHESAWDTPIPGADGDIAVIAGQSKRVYGLGEHCMVRVGASPVTAGQKLMPDANGLAIVATATNQYSARCVNGAAAGGEARVIVERGAV